MDMKRIYTWARLLLGVGLIAFLFYTVDLREMGDAIVRSDPSYILLAYVVGLGDRVLMAYKWNVLLRAQAIGIPLLKTTITYWTSTFFGLFLPATVGGDALRAYMTARDGHDTSDVVSSIVMERILGMIALMIFVMGGIVLSIWVLGERFFADIWSLFWLVSVFFAATALILVVTLNTRLVHRVSGGLRVLERSQTGRKVHTFLHKLYDSYANYRNQQRALVLFLLLSFVENLFPIFWTYCLAQAFHMDVPLFYFFILVPIVLILRRLPISIDGIGIHEGTFVYFLALVGVPPEEGLLLGVTTHALAIALVLPGGIFYLFNALRMRETDVTEIGAPSS